MDASQPDFHFEALARPCPDGGPDRLVCGIDEAGRGPWAGPVMAAAVILDPLRIPAGLADSKALTARAREAAAHAIRAQAIAWAVAEASVAEIDALNILGATHLAMQRACAALSPAPRFALVDGNRLPPLPCPAQAIVAGDARSLSVAAASILAKVARDAALARADLEWPEYGFAVHKGYGVPRHREALHRLGPCPLHRRSFRPVQQAMKAAP